MRNLLLSIHDWVYRWLFRLRNQTGYKQGQRKRA